MISFTVCLESVRSEKIHSNASTSLTFSSFAIDLILVLNSIGKEISLSILSV